MENIEVMNMFDKKTYLDYYLLNKDTVICKFTIKSLGDEEDIEIIDVYVKPPFWIVDLPSFIFNRRAPKKRENMKELLKLSGCDTLQGYLDITHSLSLIDTYWVKHTDSDLSWNDVSLFTHDFNDVIAKTAFEGGLHGYDLRTTSPEYGTDGSFAKCWIKEDNIIKLLKRGSSGARNAGLEPYSEFYSSQIANALGLKYVDYDLRMHNNRLCSVCECFTSETFSYVPFAAIDLTSSGRLIAILDKAASLGFKQELSDMLVLDALIFNEDRHKGNFGFLANNDTNEIVSFAPIFDHNLSMLCYAEKEDFDDIDKYLSTKGPRIGEDFVSVARAVLTQDMRKKLINLKGFEFKRHRKLNLPEWRLDLLEKLINKQIDLILK